jgi:DNA-binding transcriptional LysR family regulator
MAILIALVAAGQGVVMLPDLAKAERDPRVAVRPLADADLARTIYAFARKTAIGRPSIRALVDALKDAARDV